MMLKLFHADWGYPTTLNIQRPEPQSSHVTEQWAGRYFNAENLPVNHTPQKKCHLWWDVATQNRLQGECRVDTSPYPLDSPAFFSILVCTVCFRTKLHDVIRPYITLIYAAVVSSISIVYSFWALFWLSTCIKLKFWGGWITGKSGICYLEWYTMCSAWIIILVTQTQVNLT